MSNKKRRHRKLAKPRKPSCHLTTGDGAKPYDESTLQHLASLLPRVEIVHPIGNADETDKDRIVRARGMAHFHRRPYGAVVRTDILGTRYFQEQALNVATGVLIMRTKVRHVGAESPCPFPTMVVVFDPSAKTLVQSGAANIVWEPLV